MRARTLVVVGALAAGWAVTSTAAGAVAAPTTTSLQTVGITEQEQVPAQGNWLAQMNVYRANYGVPAVVEDLALSSAAAQHVQWMSVNNTLTHGEALGTAGYSASGDQAGAHSNLSMGSQEPIRNWMAAPFHGLGVLRPDLQRTGYAFDPAGGWAALDVLSATDGPAPTSFPMTWPTNRSPVDLIRYSGSESPDPLAGCGAASPTGWGLPLMASFGPIQDVRVKSGVLRASNGHVVPACLRDASSYPNVGGTILRDWGTVLVIPREPLTWSTHYSGSVTTSAGVAALDFWTASTPPTTTVRGDWTGDGVVDLLGTNAAGNLWVFEGIAGGKVRSGAKVGAGWTAFNWQGSPGDVNGDKRTDLLARRSDGTLWYYPGKGSGALGSGTKVGSGWTAMTTISTPGDFNRDGRPDLVARRSDGTLHLYRILATGGLQHVRQIGVGWKTMTSIIGMGDLNGDKRGDVVAVRRDGVMLSYLSTGTGLTSAKRIGSGWSGMTLMTSPGDLNKDGRGDLVARRSDGTLWFYAGRTGGGVLSGKQVGAGWQGILRIL